jgi:hypothetical protein
MLTYADVCWRMLTVVWWCVTVASHAVKGVVAFVDSCLAERPPAPKSVTRPPPATPASAKAASRTHSGADTGEEKEKKDKDEDKEEEEATFEDAVVVLCHQASSKVNTSTSKASKAHTWRKRRSRTLLWSSVTRHAHVCSRMLTYADAVVVLCHQLC